MMISGFSHIKVTKSKKGNYSICAWVLCVFPLLGVSGCGKLLTRDDFIGTYRADFGFATGKLVLRADGHFVQQVWVKLPPRYMTAMGTWKYSVGSDVMVFDHNYMFISNSDESHPTFEQSPKNMVAIPLVRRQFGRIQIDGDDIPWGRTPIETPYTKQ